jgi:hypothetical protein
MSIRRVLLPLLLTVVCSGCVDIRETITLRTDGSGTAHMTVTFPQLALRWLPGKPIADWIRPNLPDGVRLTSFMNSQSKMKFTGPDGKEQDLAAEVYDVDLSFDRIAALNDVRVRPDVRNAKAALAGGTPGKTGAAMVAHQNRGPDIGPFQKLTLTEDGDLLRFSRIVQAARNPDEIEADAMNRPGSTAKPEAYDLRDSKLVVSIACPGEVVEHNANIVEGRTLTWTFKLKELQEHQNRDWVIKFTCSREGDR